MSVNKGKGVILVVDDEPEIVKIVAKSAEIAGFHAIRCTDPKEAQTKINETDVDVLLTDLRMPGIDGLSLITSVLEQKPKIKVLIMTGDGEKEDAIRAIKLGVHDFLEKPLSMPRLETILKNTLEIVKERKEKESLLQEIISITHTG